MRTIQIITLVLSLIFTLIGMLLFLDVFMAGVGNTTNMFGVYASNFSLVFSFLMFIVGGTLSTISVGLTSNK